MAYHYWYDPWLTKDERSYAQISTKAIRARRRQKQANGKKWVPHDEWESKPRDEKTEQIRKNARRQREGFGSDNSSSVRDKIADAFKKNKKAGNNQTR